MSRRRIPKLGNLRRRAMRLDGGTFAVVLREEIGWGVELARERDATLLFVFPCPLSAITHHARNCQQEDKRGGLPAETMA